MSGLKAKARILPVTHGAEPLAMLRALPDAVLAMEADGAVSFSNHSAQAFFGMGEKALAGKTLADILGITHPVYDALRLGQSVSMRDTAVMGKPVSSLSAVPMEEGRCLLVINYETVPVKSEWAAKIKHSLKPAQHLARMLAHEIKNPLAGIRGAAQLLSKSGLGHDDRELASLIDSEAQRIFRLVDKVNIFDDAPQSQYAPVNLHEVLEQVEKAARSGFAAGMKIVRKYDPSLPPVHGHYDRLVQTIMNLVKNAAEAGGDEIVIRSYYDTAASIHPESHARLPVCIDIEDNGKGIDAETRQHLFEPYHTTKPKGEGLGLSIVSKIMDDHGGAVDVSSRPGKTIFKLSFPRGDKT